jgi:hypothetical protein
MLDADGLIQKCEIKMPNPGVARTEAVVICRYLKPLEGSWFRVSAFRSGSDPGQWAEGGGAGFSSPFGASVPASTAAA